MFNLPPAAHRHKTVIRGYGFHSSVVCRVWSCVCRTNKKVGKGNYRIFFLILLNEDCVIPKYEAKYERGTRFASVGKLVINLR